VNNTVTKLLEAGVKEISLMTPIPEPDIDIPQQLEKSVKFGWNLTLLDIDRAKYEREWADVRQTLQNVVDACPKCKLLDALPVLCGQTVCPTFFIDGDYARPYYSDSYHLGSYGAKKLSQLFDRSLGQKGL
jgi:hypothetical protein